MSDNKHNTSTLAESYNWFEGQFIPMVKQGCVDFWESEFEIKLYSITTNEAVKQDMASRGETYFITQLPLNAHQQATLRLSGDFVRVYLHTFLGSTSPNFKLTDLSELEIRILNSFNDFLLANISKEFIPYEEISKPALRDKTQYHLTFLVRKENTKVSKIVLSLPKNILSPQFLEKTENFTMQDFEKISTFVNIKVGMTKMALNELKALYPGDIILLENSNIHKMLVKTGNIEKEFKVNPNPSLIIDLDEDEHDVEGNLGGTYLSDKNIWDDIQIEVGAEFKKVKMTLGELKQISTGLVVDLGSAFDSKISLVVENKTVARGELVIINDHYGVKIEEIFANPHMQTQPAKQPQNKAQGAPAAQTAQQAAQDVQQEEDFDYSDFENEE